ncbi:hypothetical protein M422DRAFT_222407 [Sphaerobolus stellatus SS14]|nr:hypothetical protein M422DRAFT_222407 [Sphaerobolus stellatus SS14]
MSHFGLSDDETPRSPLSGYSSRWRSNRTNGVASNHNSPNTGQTATPSLSTSTTYVRPSGGGGVGLSDPELSETRRKKLDAINRLQNLGAQRDIDIPQIVVIGSQSAGKSSLIESISGITLPRASGTCTRCPTECRLIYSTDSWQCTVSLRFSVDQFSRAYDPVRVIQFGAIMKNPRDVEERLRRAQRAILNPVVDPQQFLDGSYTNPNNKMNFSTNCVCVEIKGPNVTDLSFCDLPGLIASVSDGGRDEDVEEVKELVSSYIRKESCIILITIACESDFETQGAYRLAKQFDPEGVRTIGVLTKPDRIPDGEHARWLKLLRNETSVLQNGWYSVKQPSTQDLERGLTSEEALRRGEEFFRTAPWSKLDPLYQKRLGTRAVIQKLHEFLMEVISKRIPEIIQELQDLLQKTKDSLQKLPKAPSNDAVLELMNLVTNFTNDLFTQADGLAQTMSEGDRKTRANQFQAIKAARNTFRAKIRATAPRFRPFSSKEVDLTEPETKRPPSPQPAFLKLEEGDYQPSSQKPLFLDEVMDKIESATSRELPGYFPFSVVQDLISDSVARWKVPALELLEEIYKIVSDNQQSSVEAYFQNYTGGGLHHAVVNIMHEYTQKRREAAERQVKWLLSLEERAWTLNKQLYEYYKTEFLDLYQERPQTYKAGDTEQSALDIMATVRAYFQVAYKRFIDTVPLAIDQELILIDKRVLQEALSLGLKITDSRAQESCRKLMAEPPQISSLREELESRRDRLLAEQKELLAI